MKRRLVTTVVVRHEESYDLHSFHAGDEVPDWAAELITNPNVWSEHPEESSVEAPSALPAPKAVARKAAPAAVSRATPVKRGTRNVKSA